MIPQRGSILRVVETARYAPDAAGFADVTSSDATGVELHLRAVRQTYWYDWHPSAAGDVVLSPRTRGPRLRVVAAPPGESSQGA